VTSHLHPRRLAQVRPDVDLQRRDDVEQHQERIAERFGRVDPLDQDLLVAQVDGHLCQSR
jgi:hypothetical protein